jgi:hypothetical protein
MSQPAKKWRQLARKPQFILPAKMWIEQPFFCGVQKNRGGCIKTMKKYHLIMICHSENGGFEEYCQ